MMLFKAVEWLLFCCHHEVTHACLSREAHQLTYELVGQPPVTQQCPCNSSTALDLAVQDNTKLSNIFNDILIF